MSDIIRNVTIALKLRPDAPPDLGQYTQGVKAYYGEILTNAANATTANNLLSESYKRITTELAAATQGALQFNQATGGIAQYYAAVISQSEEAARAVRTLSAEYNALQQIGSQIQPPSVMAPNGFPVPGAGIGTEQTNGGNIGISPTTEGIQSLDQAAEATRGFADEIDRLITSGMNFGTIEAAVQRFAEATMDALNVVDPAQRMMGIQTIMEDARRHVERFQEVDNATTQRMSRNWQGAQNSMMQAVSAASRLVSAVGFLTGSSDDVEELAKRFANVQVSIQAMSASSAMFNSASEGLQRIAAASQAAQTQLAMCAGTAGFTTRMLAGVGPAATAMQAALGPISLVITGIGLAFTIAQTAAAIFGDKTEDSAEQAAEAMKAYEDQLRSVSRELEAQTRIIDQQTRSTMLLYETKKLARGGSFTLEEAIASGQEMAVQNQAAEQGRLQEALNKAKAALPEAIKQERASALAEINDLRTKVQDREKELKADTSSGLSFEERKANAMKYATAPDKSQSEKDFIDPWTALKRSEEKMKQLDTASGIAGLEGAVTSGDLTKVSESLKGLGSTLPEVTAIVKTALNDVTTSRVEPSKFVIGEINELIRAEIAKAKGEGVDIGKGADGKYMVDADREIEKATKNFEAEMRIAQNLTADPAKLAELQFGVNTAQNPIMALQGISQFIPDDQEQGLRNNPNLTIANVQEALSDAAEFESEKVELQQTRERLQGLIDEYRQSMDKMVDVVETMQGKAKDTATKMEDLIRAGR